jgi:acylphosphatase
MVGYRARVQREAQARRLAGWVRNDPDAPDRVWIEVQGAEPALEEFRACLERPEGSSRPIRVERVGVLALDEAETMFRIVA